MVRGKVKNLRDVEDIDAFWDNFGGSEISSLTSDGDDARPTPPPAAPAAAAPARSALKAAAAPPPAASAAAAAPSVPATASKSRRSSARSVRIAPTGSAADQSSRGSRSSARSSSPGRRSPPAAGGGADSLIAGSSAVAAVSSQLTFNPEFAAGGDAERASRFRGAATGVFGGPANSSGSSFPSRVSSAAARDSAGGGAAVSLSSGGSGRGYREAAMRKAPGATAAAVRAAAPAPRGFALPPSPAAAYESPPISSESSDEPLRGELFREKGRWKKKWAPEVFVVRHGVLLTCTQEEPLLVKLCVPLKNIQSIAIDQKRHNVVQVVYVQAAPKGRQQLATLRFRAPAPEDARFWRDALFARKTASPGAALRSAAVRADAERALAALHAAMRRSGLHQLAHRLGAVVADRQLSLVRGAFSCWSRSASARSLENQKKQLAERLQQAREAMEDARVTGDRGAVAGARYGALCELASRLAILTGVRLQTAVLAWRSAAARRKMATAAAGTQQTLLGALVMEHQLHAARVASAQARHMAEALRRAARRRMAAALAGLRAHAEAAGPRRELQTAALRVLVKLRARDLAEARQKVFCAWRCRVAQTAAEDAAMLRVIEGNRARLLAAALARWNGACVVRNQRDARAVHLLHSLERCIARREQARALHALRSNAAHQNSAEAMQIAANFRFANEAVLARGKDAAADRACYQLANSFRAMAHARLSNAFLRIQAFGARQHARRHRVAAGARSLRLTLRRPQQRAFSALLMHAYQAKYASSRKQQGAMRLALALRAVRRRHLAATLKAFSAGLADRAREKAAKAAAASSVAAGSAAAVLSPAELFAVKLERLQRRVAFRQKGRFFRAARGQSDQVAFVQAIARMQYVITLGKTMEKHRATALAGAFARLRTAGRRPAGPPEARPRGVALGGVAKSPMTLLPPGAAVRAAAPLGAAARGGAGTPPLAPAPLAASPLAEVARTVATAAPPAAAAPPAPAPPAPPAALPPPDSPTAPSPPLAPPEPRELSAGAQREPSAAAAAAAPAPDPATAAAAAAETATAAEAPDTAAAPAAAVAATVTVRPIEARPLPSEAAPASLDESLELPPAAPAVAARAPTAKDAARAPAAKEAARGVDKGKFRQLLANLRSIGIDVSAFESLAGSAPAGARPARTSAAMPTRGRRRRAKPGAGEAGAPAAAAVLGRDAGRARRWLRAVRRKITARRRIIAEAASAAAAAAAESAGRPLDSGLFHSGKSGGDPDASHFELWSSDGGSLLGSASTRAPADGAPGYDDDSSLGAEGAGGPLLQPFIFGRGGSFGSYGGGSLGGGRGRAVIPRVAPSGGDYRGLAEGPGGHFALGPDFLASPFDMATSVGPDSSGGRSRAPSAAPTGAQLAPPTARAAAGASAAIFGSSSADSSDESGAEDVLRWQPLDAGGAAGSYLDYLMVEPPLTFLAPGTDDGKRRAPQPPPQWQPPRNLRKGSQDQMRPQPRSRQQPRPRSRHQPRPQSRQQPRPLWVRAAAVPATVSSEDLSDSGVVSWYSRAPAPARAAVRRPYQRPLWQAA